MSLLLIQETTPITYDLCTGTESLNTFLCTPPRKFREQFSHFGTRGFYYDENKDRYVVVSLSLVAFWPGLQIKKYTIHSETGLTESIHIVPNSFSAVTSVLWYTNWQNGELKKIYAKSTVINPHFIVTVNPDTLIPNFSDVVVPNSGINGTSIGNYLINRSSGIIVLSTSSGELKRFHYPTSTQLESLVSSDRLVIDLAYESPELGWVLTKHPIHGLSAMKMNYVEPQVETLASLQSDPTDLGFAIAFDSKRNILAVFRERQEAVDGAATHLLDLYKPVATSTILTDPVPTQPLVSGVTQSVTAHLIGDRGEAGPSKSITVVSTKPGSVLQPKISPKSNGVATFQYVPAPGPTTDVIQLGTTI